MNVDRSTARRVVTDVVVLSVMGAMLGMFVGLVVANGHRMSGKIMDPTPYQNFGITTGIVTGAIACLLAAVFYLFVVQRNSEFKPGRFLIMCGFTGALLGFITYAIVGASAERYGMVEITGAVTILDGVISTVIGAVVGAGAGFVLYKVRGYE